MTRNLLACAVLLLFAWPAIAANEGHYPNTVMDAGCTDLYDAPAAGSGSARPSVQTSGDPDGYCDHDSRIREAAAAADLVFGPFFMPSEALGVIIYADADIVSNDTDTWQVRIIEYRPHDAVLRAVHNPGEQATEGDKLFIIGPTGHKDLGAVTATVSANMPKAFYIQLDLVTATSWDGSISWRSF